MKKGEKNIFLLSTILIILLILAIVLIFIYLKIPARLFAPGEPTIQVELLFPYQEIIHDDPPIVNIFLDKTFDIKARITCTEADCGDIDLRLVNSYFETNDYSETPIVPAQGAFVIEEIKIDNSPVSLENPKTISLLKDESKEIQYKIKVQSDLDVVYTFFVYANLSANPETSSMAEKFNVKITTSPQLMFIYFKGMTFWQIGEPPSTPVYYVESLSVVPPLTGWKPQIKLLSIPTLTETTCHQPAGYLVLNAGTVVSNGIYVDEGMLSDGVPMYSKPGWYLFRITSGANTFWMIHNSLSITDPSDARYFQWFEIGAAPDTPPETGWIVSIGRGIPPAPTVILTEEKDVAGYLVTDADIEDGINVNGLYCEIGAYNSKPLYEKSPRLDIASINIRDNIANAPDLLVTPLSGQNSNINISVYVIGENCESVLVTATICSPDFNIDGQTCYNNPLKQYQLTYEIKDSDVCFFAFSGNANTPEFWREPGNYGLVASTDSIKRKVDFTYQELLDMSYPDVLDFGELTTNQWNQGKPALGLDLINHGNANLFLDFSSTGFACVSSGCTDVWNINNDFQLDDDNLYNEATETNFNPIFLSSTLTRFPSSYLPVCTSDSCSALNEKIKTYYHLRPPLLRSGDYENTITIQLSKA